MKGIINTPRVLKINSQICSSNKKYKKLSIAK
jgi:hypothetical protein